MEKCENCIFADLKGTDKLHCRRFPPQAQGAGTFLSARWPIVSPHDWCGEFKGKGG